MSAASLCSALRFRAGLRPTPSYKVSQQPFSERFFGCVAARNEKRSEEIVGGHFAQNDTALSTVRRRRDAGLKTPALRLNLKADWKPLRSAQGKLFENSEQAGGTFEPKKTKPKSTARLNLNAEAIGS